MGTHVSLTAADGHRLSAAHALVVVQEIFGVNRHMRTVADRFAAAGYLCVAPALFDRIRPGIELGYAAEDVAEGRALRPQVPEAGTMADIAAAADSLGRRTLGIVGYCWGGTVAWWGATRTTSFKAAVGWYGGGIAGTRTETPHCPVQLHFGEKDSGIPLSDVDAIRAAQPEVEIFVYPGAQHGFGCDERASYSAPDAAEAQSRTLAFFASQLSK
jgi:carboxymethylenebutenolidase